MLKSQQRQLAHNTNVALVGIRQVELRYYYNYFQTFGDSGSLIAGFLFGSITQILGMYVDVPRYVKTIYWIGSTISFLAGMHVMIHSCFNGVYGQGNVLYGKVGAIKNTLKGYAEEQRDVLLSFLIMFFFFGISIIGTCGCVYYQDEAIVGTIITILSMIFWYKDSIEVYNLFKWTDVDEMREAEDFKSAREDDNDDNIAKANRLLEKDVASI